MGGRADRRAPGRAPDRHRGVRPGNDPAQRPLGGRRPQRPHPGTPATGRHRTADAGRPHRRTPARPADVPRRTAPVPDRAARAAAGPGPHDAPRPAPAGGRAAVRPDGNRAGRVRGGGGSLAAAAAARARRRGHANPLRPDATTSPASRRRSWPRWPWSRPAVERRRRCGSGSRRPPRPGCRTPDSPRRTSPTSTAFPCATCTASSSSRAPPSMPGSGRDGWSRRARNSPGPAHPTGRSRWWPPAGVSPTPPTSAGRSAPCTGCRRCSGALRTWGPDTRPAPFPEGQDPVRCRPDRSRARRLACAVSGSDGKERK